MAGIGHFQPYRKWYGTLDQFRDRQNDVLFVGFQESLDEDFERLLNVLKIREELCLPDDDVAAHKNPVTVERSISKQGLANLKQWYAEDYEFIELCQAWMRLRGR